MGRQGFTLVELIVVMGIIGILLSIAALNFSASSRKSLREAEIRQLYADIAEVQINALQQKRPHTIVVSSTGYSIRRFESASDTVGVLVAQKTLTTALTAQGGTPKTIRYNTLGMSDVASPQAVCTQDNSSAGAIDAIIISPGKINLAKRQAGEACQSDKCTVK